MGSVSSQGLNNNRNPLIFSGFYVPVRLIGLEPTQPELPDPKSGASTNFATGAWGAFSEDVLRLRIIKQDLFSVRLAPSFAGAKVVFFWLTVVS